MNGHATMNRIYRLVWSHHSEAWVAVAEIARGRGKRSGVVGSEMQVEKGAKAVGRSAAGDGPGPWLGWREGLLGAALLSMGMTAFAAPPTNQLPTGGSVVAGQAAISQSGARMDINQSSSRAVIDWSSYNVGAAAQVNYNQPSAASATLNRVMDTQASQILGKITANGQVLLVNPNGVYFGKTASVDVGGLVASTKDISNENFMSGNMKFSRNGATGSVVNEGELRTALGGYIALLAPEVRNEGLIVAQMGTVALASGESVTLQFDGNNSLAGIVVEPSKIKALVENKGAVLAPGGVIILSARSLDRLQGGIVRNSGKLEATGLTMKGGKIVLEASDRIENAGTISANAGSDGSPAGEVTLAAPAIVNSGVIAARGQAASAAPVASAVQGGSIKLAADTITQSAGAKLDVSSVGKAGTIVVEATADIALSGTVEAASDEGAGGEIGLSAGNNITLAGATVDASGATAGGRIKVEGNDRHAPIDPAQTPPTVAILGNSVLRTSSRRGQGGNVTLTGGHVGLFDDTLIDASGASGGGSVLVGGDLQGKNPDIANAQATYVAENAVIRADALEAGQGGKVIIWADGLTRFLGQASARGGAQGGDGGFVEVSGKGVLDFRGQVDLLAPLGHAGTLLLDPYDLTISASGSDTNVNAGTPFDATGTGSILTVNTLQNALSSGNVTVTTGSSGAEAGDITVADGIGWFSTYNLTLSANRNINLNADISAFKGSLTLTAGTGGVSGAITLANDMSINLLQGSVTASAIGDITQAAVSGGTKQGYFDIAGTSSFSSSAGSVILGAADNKFTGAVSLASGGAGSIAVTNGQALVLGALAGSGSGGVSLGASGNITGTTLVSAGSVTLATTPGSNGSINLSGAFSASGSVSLSADGSGGIAIPQITGNVTLVSVSAGGTVTLGDSGTGAITLDSASGNVVSGTAGGSGQASGSVSITGSSITINDPIRTRGGNLNLTATGGAVTAASGADLTTTANTDTGTASGSVTVTATTGLTLQDITTTGANNSLGVGSNAAAVTLSSAAGDINVGAVTTTGGDATAGASTNRNGGNAGNIVFGAPGGIMYLNGDLNAIGGGFVGSATRGLGGYIELQTPVVLTADRLMSTGTTSGNVYALSTIDSDSASRSLTITAGTGDVRLRGTVGQTAELSSLTISGVKVTVEKDVTTNAAAGVSISAAGEIRLGDDTVANGSGAMTVNTLAGNGTVTLSTPVVYLDDAVTFTRGSGAISVSSNLYSNSGERNNLSFNGAGGGVISVGLELGGGSAGSATSLGDILISSVTDLNFQRNVSARSLTSLNGTGRIYIGGSNTYGQYYDGTGGLQLATTGTNNVQAGDEDITVYGSIVATNAAAPISINAINGALTQNGSADLTTAGGNITLQSKNNLTLGTDSDLTSSGGAISVTSVAGSALLNGDYVDVASAGGLISISGVGVTHGNTGNGRYGTINSGSGKIRIDGNHGQILSYGTLMSTDADSGGTSAILIQDAYVASAATGAVKVRAVTASAGTLEIGQVSGSADVLGDVQQYDSDWADSINIKTLKVASSGSINVTDTANIIDELGNVVLGGSLTVQAKGRTTGMSLTGDVTATSVTIKTGLNSGGTNGILALGARNITATTGSVILQGRGITQDAASVISSAGTVTIYGSDYATEANRGDAILTGSIIAANTSANAVTIFDVNTIQLPNITAGSIGSRGGLRLGTHDHNGYAYRRAYGPITQTAGTQLKIGALDIRQNAGSGVADLSASTNEVQTIGYVERGGAFTLVDADTEANNLAMTTNITDGSNGTLVKVTTGGSLNLGGFTIYAKGIELSSGAGGITSSADLQSHYGGGGDLILNGGGGNITLNNRLYNSGAGNDIFIQNANDVLLNNVELHGSSKLMLGGVGTGAGGSDVPLTGNVTQNSRIYSDSDTVDVTGAVLGSVVLGGGNQIYRLGYFSAGGNFTFNDQDRNLTLQGAITSAAGNVAVTNGNYGITLTNAGSLSADAVTKSVSLTGYTGNTNGFVTVQGAISSGSGGISVIGGGGVSNTATGTLSTTGGVTIRSAFSNVGLGGDVTAGANGIKLTSGGTIVQSGGILSTTGTLSGPNQSNGAPSVSAPSALGTISLNQNNEVGSLGPFYLYNTSAQAFSFKDVTGGLSLAGAIENSHGAITITTAGGALDLASFNVYAGGQASGGANIILTGRGIIQQPSTINATGGTTVDPRSGTSGGTITLTGHDGTASGTMSLNGTIQTASNSTSAVTLRGTSALALPTILAPNGSLVLGDSTPTIGSITGPITQSASTYLDIKTLTISIGGTAVLANSGNKIVQLGAIAVGDDAGLQYDLDVYDSTSGLSLTQDLGVAGGVRLRTATGDGASGVLALGTRSVLAHGDVFLGGDGVTQAAGSVVNANNGGTAGTGGGIRVDGGGGANNISLLGTLTTDDADSTAIEIVNATNATLNVISATAGTVALGVDTKELTGTVSQVAVTGTISAATLTGDAGVVTLAKTNVDNLGAFVTTGVLSLKDLGGTGTAGLKLTGDVHAGAASSIETTDGILNLDTHTVDASGFDLVLKGLSVAQTTGSMIKSTTAEIYGDTGNITLDSVLNDFTGQVTVNSTGSSVSIRDANQLSMNALTGKLALTTSITAIAGTQLVLATENLTTTSGSIDFRSLDGNLSTPGTLTTGSGSVSLYATTSTPGSSTNGNVQVNQVITTGTGNVHIDAQKEVNLSKSIVSGSGNLWVGGDTITHSTGSSGAPLSLQTGGAGTITVGASGTGGFVMGQYYSYLADTGTISITSGSTADLANISSSGAVTVNAVGLVQQVGAGSTIAADSLAVSTASNGAITLTNATNDIARLSLRSRNVGDSAAGSGTITYNDANGFAVRQIETTGLATLTAHGDITTDSVGYPGTVAADVLTVKTLKDGGADILLNAAGNDVNSLTAGHPDRRDPVRQAGPVGQWELHPQRRQLRRAAERDQHLRF